MDDFVAELQAADAPAPAATGADLRGWSALPLLGDASSVPWLFVQSTSHAWLSNGPLAAAQFVEAAADYGAAWPMSTGALAGVVIDGDAVAPGTSGASLGLILSEAVRVVGPRGTVLLVSSDRVVPRQLRTWRAYGTRAARRWCRTAASLGLHVQHIGLAGLDGPRIIDIAPMSPAGADRVVLAIGRGDAGGTATLASMIDDASRRSGVSLRLDRMSVRKIGKTAVFLVGADGKRFIMRVARSPIALRRAARNFETLCWFQQSSLPTWIKGRVPAPVTRGSRDGFQYFIETCVHGEAGPRGTAREGGREGWEMAAVRYISALHGETKRRVLVDEEQLVPMVRTPIARLERLCDAAEAAPVFRRLIAACERSLRNRVVPLVRSHGDLTESNCLFDGDGTLTAVVDWEVSESEGLPLADLLQLMPIRGETSSNPRWQRFDAWLELYRDPERVALDRVMGGYAFALGVPRDAIPGLVLLHWVTHVADRVEARRGDERWMRMRLWQPLELLGRVL